MIDLQLRRSCTRAHNLLKCGYDGLFVLLWSDVKATYMPEKHANLSHEG